jgi:hypothetical protein
VAIIYTPSGTKTFGNIIEDLISDFQGYTVASDQVTSLTNPIGATDTSFVVDDGTVVSTGTLQIGDEMMWVQSVDPTSNTVNLLPRGRGWGGTTAVAHATGDTVTVSPAYPRSRIKTAINASIQATYPMLFGVTSTEFTLLDPIHLAWGIPADVEFVLDVRWRDPLSNWQRIRGWEIDRQANTSDFPTGQALLITQRIIPGSTVRVTYGGRPGALVNESDLFTSTGLEEGIADAIELDVKARMLPILDLARLQVTHASAAELEQTHPIGSAIAAGAKFSQMYQQRLQVESLALHRRYPARVHITR